MNQGGNGGDGEDPFDLDPFGGSEYDPGLAFALVAAENASGLLEDAFRFVEQQKIARPEVVDQISTSASKSADVQLQDLRELVAEAHQFHLLAKQEPSRSSEHVQSAIHSFHEARGIHERLMLTAHNITQEGGVYQMPPATEIDPTLLQEPSRASSVIHQQLGLWVSQNRDSVDGKMVVIKSTPGVGKTQAMIRAAHQEHLNKQRVVVAVRTKDMIAEPSSEMRSRIVKTSPMGKLTLAVIYGRDETNCNKPETVEAVMAHGYSPGPTVCTQCEYHPENSPYFGLGICGYYQERISADITSKGARRGIYWQYPLVLTTHASLVAATHVDGGRYGSFWGADVAFIDEDPTDAMETDLILSRSQCEFRSRSPDTRPAGVMAQLCREAIEIAIYERGRCSENGFRGPGEEKRNSHPIHNKYDSVYTGQDLERIMTDALQRMSLTQNISSLQGTFRDVGANRFSVSPGALVQVESSDDINSLGIPPSSLIDVADAIHGQMVHGMQLRRIVYQHNNNTHPKGANSEEILEELIKHTEIDPMSYEVRLECLPMDIAKGRERDEWRFVLRQFQSLSNRSASLVIGDAYAQKEHYEYLFERDAELIDVTTQLNSGASFLRVLDSECSISRLREGGLQRVITLAENQLREEAKPGDRVLIYGHQELREHVEEWAEATLLPMGLIVAYEHWWGGRGKDHYNGWEFTVCISDPVLSLSGLAHVANARAFRASCSAKTNEEKLLHAQKCKIGSDSRGAVYALRQGHPRITLEHERMNIAELTQALHRSRPAHNPVRIITYGEMELSRDLVAQTESVVGPGSRKLSVSNARRKKASRDDRPVDLFTTSAEAFEAIKSIIRHYGCYSTWFSHALIARSRGLGRVAMCQSGRDHSDTKWHKSISEILSDAEGLSQFEAENVDVALKDNCYVGHVHIRPRHHVSPSNWVPDQALDDIVERRGSTEPAGGEARTEPDPRTVIERVWHPSVYWDLLTSNRGWPRAIRAAHEMLDAEAKNRSSTIETMQLGRNPKWAKCRSGGKPKLYYDTSVMPVASAVSEYFRIVEAQYGLSLDGQVVRPKATMEVPESFSDLPF